MDGCGDMVEQTNLNTNIKSVKVPLTKIKENRIKFVGALLSILDNEQEFIGIQHSVSINYAEDLVLDLANIDIKLLKSIIYYIKLNGSIIKYVSKKYSNGDFIRIQITNDEYIIEVSDAYYETVIKKIEIMLYCKATGKDSISTIDIRGINRKKLISLISKKVRVKDCININISNNTLNIIQCQDIIIMIDINNIYIVDLYGDFEFSRITIRNEILTLICCEDEQRANMKMEYSFI